MIDRLEAATAPIATSRGWIFGADAALVAHAPRDIAFLLEENERLETLLDGQRVAHALIASSLIEGGSDV